MSDDFTTEPIIGHHVTAETYRYESELTNQLDALSKKYNIPRQNRDRIRIEVGDVDWEETKEVTMRVDVFEDLMEWYEDE